MTINLLQQRCRCLKSVLSCATRCGNKCCVKNRLRTPCYTCRFFVQQCCVKNCLTSPSHVSQSNIIFFKFRRAHKCGCTVWWLPVQLSPLVRGLFGKPEDNQGSERVHQRISKLARNYWIKLLQVRSKGPRGRITEAKLKAADKTFQIQNNLAPVLKCFIIDWNRFKQRLKRAKTVLQTATETTRNGDKRKRTWSVHTHKQTVRVFVLLVSLICFPVLTQRAKQPG